MKQRKARSTLVVLFVLTGILLLRGSLTTPAHTAAASSCAWNLIPSQDPSTGTVIYGGIAASSKDAWMVGSFVNYSGPGPFLQTLTEQWNGTNWQTIPSPNPGVQYNALLAVTRVPHSQELWAVGYLSNTINGPPLDQTLIEQWNGTSWQVVPSPNVGQGNNDLNGVVAVSAKDVWAVGTSAGSQFGLENTLIEHWDGTQWSVIPSPDPSPYLNTLEAIAASSESSIWAMGTERPQFGGQASAILIEHWDGTQWSVVPSPSPGSYSNGLSGIAIVSPTSVWAVGSTSNLSGPTQTLIEHWDGTQWSIVTSPNPGSSVDVLSSAVALGAKNIWAVGYDVMGNNPGQTLTLRWNGTAWKVVPSPNSGSDYNYLDAVTRIPGTNQLWAMGTHFSPNTGQDGSITMSRC